MKPQFPWEDSYGSSECKINVHDASEHAVIVLQIKRAGNWEAASVDVRFSARAELFTFIESCASLDEAKIACESWYAHHLCVQAAVKKPKELSDHARVQFEHALPAYAKTCERIRLHTSSALSDEDHKANEVRRQNHAKDICDKFVAYMESFDLMQAAANQVREKRLHGKES